MTQLFENLRQRLVFGQRQTHASVTRQIAGTGQNQVPHAGQTHEGFALRAKGQTEPGDFRQAPRHQRGTRVQAEPQTIAGAGRNRQYILDRPTDLDPDQIVVGVDAQTRRVQLARRFPGKGRIIGRQRDGGRLPGCHFLGKTGTRTSAPQMACAPSTSVTT